ncbi:MAG: O-sialoglycoprotein endopeptidase, partial [Candidatus Hermodarchaeota archaeon]
MSNEIVMEKVIHKGAEANLIYGRWFEKEAIFKQRIPKGYRIEQIDKKLRINRTLNEGKALIRVKDYGINVPQVYEIDASNSTIVMKYIKGEKLKEVLG